MKKKILLVGIIATMGLGTFIVSCSKDDSTCTCKMDGKDPQTVSLPYGDATTCSEVEYQQALIYTGHTISCH